MLLALQNIIGGFLRRTWLVAVVTVTVCAAFAAHAVAAFSEAELTSGTSPAPGAAPKAAPVATAPSPRRAPPNGDAFVERNIFCSTCTPAKPQPGGGGGYQGHPAVLIATSIGVEPRATVRVVPTEVQGSWALGEDIPGVGRIDAILSTSIEVADGAGNTKTISLLGAATSGTPSTTDQKPLFPGIEKLGDGKFEVERSLVRQLVTMGGQPGMGRANPIVVDGEVQGIQLFGISSKSPGFALDLRSGDTISSIDGVPLKTLQQLLDLFARLDQVSSVELGGKRRDGKPLKVTMQLR